MQPYPRAGGPVGPGTGRGLTLYPIPAGSRLSPGRWADLNSHWRANRVHPHGVPEHFAWGTVLWSPWGAGPRGVVVADPSVPVRRAHDVADEVAAARISPPRSFSGPISRRSLWGAAAGFVPAMVAVAATPFDGVLAVSAAAGTGVLTGMTSGRRHRWRAPRRAWRHAIDPVGAAAVFPHLRWLTDLVEVVPDQAAVVWGGVREILWVAPSLQEAALPLQQVSVALARTAEARRSRDTAALAGMPEPDLAPQTSRADDIAADLVGALGFEEEIYRRVTDDLSQEFGPHPEPDDDPAPPPP